jgi:serine/threonine protein kinase
VYLARDEGGTPFAIKEYLPASLPLRNETLEIKLDEESSPIFRHGLKCFFEEGRALAMITHPNVVRVENFFRANDTCYMVMQYVRGRTLQFHIQRHRHEFTEGFIRRTFVQLMNGLREVHTNKLLHLDIKPSNIYVRNDGSPVLIDFGAVRQMLTQHATRLDPMYTPGYAPPEQYRQRDLLGPWSDIYSVGASMYTCIAASAPPPADQRLQKDRYVPARQMWAGKYTSQLLQTIDWCLRLDHLRRPQSVFALQKVLLRERDPTASLTSRTAGFREMVAKLAGWRAGR